MEGRVKILETYPKSEEIKAFLPNFHAFADFIQYYRLRGAELPCLGYDNL